MSNHDWHVLFAFGLLTGALAFYDAPFALSMVGVASAVILVRNADKVAGVLKS